MKRTLTLMAFVALFLTGCSSAGSDAAAESDDQRSQIPIETIEPQKDWVDEDQKLRTFMQYICYRDGVESEILPYTHATAAAVGVLADTTATPEDKRIALEITTLPEDWYEQAWAHHEAAVAAGEYSVFDEVPRTLTPNNAATCEGWVWEKHLEQAFVKEFDTFTFEQAREANVI